MTKFKTCKNCFYLTKDDYCISMGDKYRIDIESEGDCGGFYKKVNKHFHESYKEMLLSVGQYLKVETSRGFYLLMVIDSHYSKVKLIDYLHFNYRIDLNKQFIVPDNIPINKITKITGVQYGKELKKEYSILYKEKIKDMKEYYKGKIPNKEIKLKEKEYRQMLKELKQNITRKYIEG